MSTRLTRLTGCERAAVGAPDERVRSVEIGRGRGGGREPVERVGDAAEEGVVRLGGVGKPRTRCAGDEGALPQSRPKLQTLAGAVRENDD